MVYEIHTETSSLRTLKIMLKKPQQNCMFMNSASVQKWTISTLEHAVLKYLCIYLSFV